MKIAITRTDGRVSIMTLATAELLDSALEKWKSLWPNQYVSHREIDERGVLPDRTWRDAWRDTGTQITVDMDHAAQIQAQRALVAEEQAVKQARLASLAKDPMVTAAKTPEELKLAIPERT